MKKLGVLLFVMAFWLTACSTDDDYSKISYVITPIDSVDMPDSARLSLTGSINIETFIKSKNNCERFYDYGYEIDGDERFVATWLLRDEGVSCGEEKTYSPILKFRPQEAGTYFFKFWQGERENEQGETEDVYLEKEIVILE